MHQGTTPKQYLSIVTAAVAFTDHSHDFLLYIRACIHETGNNWKVLLQVVSDCLEGIMGEKNFAELNQGGTSAQVLRNPRVLKKFQLGFEQIRASTDLPDDAQEWLEVRSQNPETLHVLLEF